MKKAAIWCLLGGVGTLCGCSSTPVDAGEQAPLGVPVWSHAGIVCTGEIYKSVVKLTFMYGASLPDPTRLFNASLEGGTRRAIDIPEGHEVDAAAFKALIKAAVAYNLQHSKKR